LPQYWSPARDFYLRNLFYSPFHEFWSGAIGIAISKMASQSWEVEGDTPRLRANAQQLLLEADSNGSWVSFLGRHLQDFLLTDNGAFIEVVRASKGAGSRIIGLMHLDSLRITRTGDPENPAIYRDTKGIDHVLKPHQIIMLSDMPSSSETWYGVGLSAASRAWGAIKKLEAVERYIYEKVSGERPLAVDLVGGVTEGQLKQAIDTAREDNMARGNVQYMGAIVVPTLSDIAITHTRINFAELPDGFEYEQQFNNAVLQIANAIGLDIQDLQPLSGQRLGTAMQSEVLEAKSRGRGLSAWRQQFTHMLNQYVMSDTVTFAFSEQDVRVQKQEAEVFQTYADAAGSLVTAQVITSDQAKQVLADAHQLPDEFVPEDTTPNETLTDAEKPEAEQNAAEAQPTEEEMKSRRDVRLEYRGELYTLADKAMRGKMSATDMAKAHRELVKDLGREMYLEALKVNGILEDEIDSADEEEIQGWVATQLPHVSQFARDAAAATLKRTTSPSG
jgi:hypothetical protein